MRRTLLSCTSLVRNGLLGSALAALLPAAPAEAADLVDTLSNIAGFQPAGARGAGHRAGLARLLGGRRDPPDAHARAHGEERGAAARRNRGTPAPGRPLRRAAVRRAADPDLLAGRRRSRRRSPATSRWCCRQALRSACSRSEPGLRRNRRCRWITQSMRCATAGEGFLLTSHHAHGHTIEAIGRAIGGQAIVRIRELSGLRRELAETNLRYKALFDETEMLRGFADRAPWPIWAKGDERHAGLRQPRLCRATEAACVTDAIERNLELLDSADRDRDVARAGGRQPISPRGCRSWSAASGASMTCAPQCRRRQRRHRHRRQRGRCA